jgi:hypothetical protein
MKTIKSHFVKIIPLLFLLLAISCDKKDFEWNLPRANDLDSSVIISNAIALETLDCGSLAGISSLYQGMNGTTGLWGISASGYDGNCWCAPNPNYSGNLSATVGTHFIVFSRNFNNLGYFEFWLNTDNSGFNNLIPNIFIDDSLQIKPYSIQGQSSSFYWQKFRSGIVSPGNHSIKIEFTGSYYTFKLDEITFFEVQ